jgi:hypothetical protein
MAKRSLRETAFCGLAVVFIAMVLGRQAVAGDVNFAGKSITMVISAGVGGGTDGTARVFGRYLPEYLPGKPNVIFQNVPGGGGITGVNYFYKQGKRDGLMMLAGDASDIDPTVLHKSAVQYDPKQLVMLGGFPAPSSLLILRKEALQRFHDASQKPATMGEVNAERNTGQMAAWGPRYLNWNIRWVLGYAGTPDIVLAVERGEVDMIITYGDVLLDQFRKDPEFVFPAQIGDVRDGKFVRAARFPDVPLFSELIEPKLKTPREIKAFRAWTTVAHLGKWFALPPDTPAQIAEAYRQAFLGVIKNPDFIADALRVLGADFSVSTGEEMQKSAVAVTTVDNDDLDFFDELRESVGVPKSR